VNNPNINNPNMNSQSARIASGLNILASIWLIASPFLLGYSGLSATAMWDAIIVGVVVLILAWIREANPRGAVWPSWVNVVLGLWMIIAPFVLGTAAVSGAIMWNDIIVGVLFVIFGAWSALAANTAATP
jgi:uncharacterized membrane protein YtjA (UPF0391 family)